MRVLFFGTPLFAAEVLRYLLDNGINVVGVVSKPDRPQGRSRQPVATPVKLVAEEYALPLFQPERVSLLDHYACIKGFNADIFVVVAYGEIIKEHLLQLPPLGCINLHASLLPKYRGAAPIQRAIMEGAKESGVTIMHMVKQMDAGDIIATATVPISAEMTAGELSSLLCNEGRKLLCATLADIAAGRATRRPQDHSLATFAPKVELEECQVTWQRPALEIHNLIRGANPEPGAWCFVEVTAGKKRLRLHSSRCRSDLKGMPGERLGDPSTLIVAAQGGAVELLAVQLEGKKTTTAGEFLRGHRDHLSFI